MNEQENSHSGLQKAVDLAHAARAARRILQAAAAAGVQGAAAAAVKESVPFLLKILLTVLAALLIIPMVVFTALPNIFFGWLIRHGRCHSDDRAGHDHRRSVHEP